MSQPSCLNGPSFLYIYIHNVYLYKCEKHFIKMLKAVGVTINANECTKVQNPRCHACANLSTGKWRTVRMHSTEQCWISATERFQRKPHKFFDPLLPAGYVTVFSG